MRHVRKALIKRINQDCGLNIPEDTPVKHSGASPQWLASGRFKWYFVGLPYPYNDLGSCSNMTELLRSKEKLKMLAGPGLPEII